MLAYVTYQKKAIYAQKASLPDLLHLCFIILYRVFPDDPCPLSVPA